MTTCDLKRLQESATHARTVRDYHALEVVRLESELASQRASLQVAGDTYHRLDAEVLSATAPKLEAL
jgi:hypothetical protein